MGATPPPQLVPALEDAGTFHLSHRSRCARHRTALQAEKLWHYCNQLMAGTPTVRVLQKLRPGFLGYAAGYALSAVGHAANLLGMSTSFIPKFLVRGLSLFGRRQHFLVCSQISWRSMCSLLP
jgi:hypothetical protein